MLNPMTTSMEHFDKRTSYQHKSPRLTGGVGANVDDLALGSVDLVLVRGWELGFHHYGVLRPGLQRQNEMTRFNLLFVSLRGSTWRVHVSDHPAVGAAGILPIKLGYVLKGSIVGKNNNSTEMKGVFYVGPNCILLEDGRGDSLSHIFKIFINRFICPVGGGKKQKQKLG